MSSKFFSSQRFALRDHLTFFFTYRNKVLTGLENSAYPVLYAAEAESDVKILDTGEGLRSHAHHTQALGSEATGFGPALLGLKETPLDLHVVPLHYWICRHECGHRLNSNSGYLAVLLRSHH